jgi:HSP20 family molecular chaperone IbpA
VLAYLVTTPDPIAIATAKYLWGSAQQVELGIGGVLINRGKTETTEFEPLPVTSMPNYDGSNWQPLIDELSKMPGSVEIPKATEFIMAERKVKVFLPGFDKKNVKLTQSGSEITIEAGDQRRNITLPPAWRGNSVTGAKFANGYLEVTLG